MRCAGKQCSQRGIALNLHLRRAGGSNEGESTSVPCSMSLPHPLPSPMPSRVTSTLFPHAYPQTRRKDWLESMIHHVVTSGLLAYSYAVNFTRVGVVVILMHDVSGGYPGEE